MKKVMIGTFLGLVFAILNPVNVWCAESEEVSAFYEQINEARESEGLYPLTISTELEKAATQRAEECEKNFSHIRPNGKDFWTVCPAYVYGENLSVNCESQTVTCWMNSPTHRENILAADFKSMGIGFYSDSNGNAFITLEFGF